MGSFGPQLIVCRHRSPVGGGVSGVVHRVSEPEELIGREGAPGF